MKRWWIAIIIGILLGGAGSGFFLWKTKYSKPLVSTTDQQSNTDSTPAQSLTVWEDPAGFSFSYPQGLTIDTHPEDQENYAHLEFTSPEHSGKILIWAKDLPSAATIDAWVKANKAYAGATVMDSTLAGAGAKKILLAGPPQSRHVVSYADDLLFIVEVTLEDAAFWSPIADGIIDSFKIIPLEEESAAAPEPAGTGEYVPADEEETIL